MCRETGVERCERRLPIDVNNEMKDKNYSFLIYYYYGFRSYKYRFRDQYIGMYREYFW